VIQCPREDSRVADEKYRPCVVDVMRGTQKVVSVLENSKGWQPKIGVCVQANFRVSKTKNLVSVLGKCPGWQHNNGVSVQEKY
jgi:hypothetical protein